MRLSMVALLSQCCRPWHALPSVPHSATEGRHRKVLCASPVCHAPLPPLQYHITLDELLKLNPHIDPHNYIYPGEASTTARDNPELHLHAHHVQ